MKWWVKENSANKATFTEVIPHLKEAKKNERLDARDTLFYHTQGQYAWLKWECKLVSLNYDNHWKETHGTASSTAFGRMEVFER